MRSTFHLAFCIAVSLAAGAGLIAQKVTTEEELDKAMKRAQPAMGAAAKALQAGNAAEAGKQLAIVRQAMIDTQDFWIKHKREDAVKANKETIAKLESTEKLLSGASPDIAAATASLKQEVGASCRTCHEAYRVRDAENNWVLKPGSLGN